MFFVTEVAQTPEVGVKIYAPEFELSTVLGFHVPVIEFVDVVPKTGALAPAQKEGVVAKFVTVG